MKALICIIILCACASALFAGSPTDCTGVVRAFGDMTSWMSSSFVIGDGSWVLAPSDAVIEKVGPATDRTIRYPIFISSYTGQAYQCELKCVDKSLGVALLKLPVSGLPAAALGQSSDLSKVAFGTLGQLTGDDPVGNRWPTDIYGIAREKSESTNKLLIDDWSAGKGFIADWTNITGSF